MKKLQTTQYYIYPYRRAVNQGCWRWQRRGKETLIAWPAIWGSDIPDVRRKGVIKLSERTGALGVTVKSSYFIWPFTRDEVEHNFGVKLMPYIGDEVGPWLTVIPL